MVKLSPLELGIGGLCQALVFAPFAGDAPLLDEILRGEGIHTHICGSFEALLESMNDAALMVVVTEEAFAQCDTELLLAKLDEQPQWSDLPFLGLIGNSGGAQHGARLAALAQIGNITLLERPVAREALVMLVRTAVRARTLQYKIREQFEELANYSRELEERVDARTAALAREVDERKRVEAALQESRRLEALGRLTGGIAHDFNNMLQVVSGGTELINALAGQADPRLARPLDSIRRACKNGAKLTQQLLAYARHQPLHNTAINLQAHVHTLTDLLRHSLGRESALHFDVAPDLWAVRADLAQLDAAILNVVFNARDAMPQGGAVTIALRNVTLPDAQFPEVAELSGDFVALAITDSGTGMTEEAQARAFEPFYTTKAVGKGTGLGLSQVQGFAVQSGGQAYIRSLPHGTLVGFVLPRSADEGAITELPSAPSGATNHVRGKRILCVEDHYEVMAVALAIFEQLGAEVVPASSGDEAITVPLDSVDVVFSDVMMPGSMDGVALAQYLRRQFPQMPIVLASGYVLDPERLAELDVTFIQKPYTATDVEAAIAQELARRGS